MSDAITRLNAALEGRYHIERQLGEGGMATVYLARDEKHNRSVALKVLKPELAAVVGADRFLAEIETTANLQHPHILPLFDSGEADGFLFYVMPYVEGESLRDRLDREHQLPVDEAVEIAKNVAEALDYAHRHGVIHRDIKPANILLQDGKPLVSDFGIALAIGAAGGGRLTETGLSLGTPHYMSPEQATGDLGVGAATDIYALGCVLYEALAGHPPYIGGTAQAILGKIVTGDADPVSKHRRSVPRHVDATIRKALEKVPADRFANAKDFTRALGDPAFRHGAEATGARAVGPGPWKAVAATFAVLFLIAAGVAVRSFTRPDPHLPVARFESPFLEGQEPVLFGATDFALSPDGRLLVYRGPRGDGDLTAAPLWLRRWDDPVATQLREAVGFLPSVSPDGRRMVYVEPGPVIRVMSFEGGPTTTLGEGAWPHWGPDGDIYFRTPEQALARVPATGGQPETMRPLPDSASGQRWEDFLPGGEFALIRQVMAEPEFGALRIATGEYTRLEAGSGPRYASSGHLLFVADRTLMAAPFEARSLRMGEAVPLIDSVLAYTISDAGSLVYSTGLEASVGPVEPVWVNRSGAIEPVDQSETGWVFEAGIGRGGSYGWHLSPDGARVAVTRLVDGNTDVWIKSLPDGPFRRLTSDEGDETSPFWSPDGSMVAYNRGANGAEVWQRRADGTGAAEPLVTTGTDLKVQGAWSPDGDWVVVRDQDISGFRPGVDGVVTPMIATEFGERGPALSPDGRWIAYSSNQSGREEVYVRPFPDVDASLEQVSVDGGSNPVWAHSGNELFFIDSEQRMTVARVEPGARFQVLGREVLFPLTPDLVGYSNGDGGDDLYDVAPGDQRFLMGRLVDQGRGRIVETGGRRENRDPQRLILVENFFEELRERVPN